jgi:DNA (cytosine-5)-methyltransferase 1
MEQLKILDLFSGLGGFSLGLERTGKFKTVAFCEIDKYCTLLLQKHWKGVKIYEDVRKINKEQFDTDGIEYPDIITGGFPCQPFSVAGKQKGTGDDRHLWPEMFRIIKTFKPKFVIGENVKGLINIQDGVVFETVCTDLESEGYEVQAFNIPAAGVGAPHRRERIWILATNVANSISDNEREQVTRGDEEEKRIQEEYRQDNSTTRQSSRTSAIRNGDRGYEDMANTESERTRSNNEGVRQGISGINRGQGTIGTKKDMANSNTRFSNGTNEEIFSRGQTSNISSTGGGDKNVENSRCTLQQGTVFQERMKMKLEKGMPISLNDQVAHPNMMWPTPRANKVIPMITDKNREKLANRNKSNLEEEVAGHCGQATGSLNPTWVEWLMGYPAGYTDLKDWEILSSRKSPKKSAKQS